MLLGNYGFSLDYKIAPYLMNRVGFQTELATQRKKERKRERTRLGKTKSPHAATTVYTSSSPSLWRVNITAWKRNEGNQMRLYLWFPWQLEELLAEKFLDLWLAIFFLFRFTELITLE